MTKEERQVRSMLSELDTDYTARKSELERRLQYASDRAEVIRQGLLYGTGNALVSAVRSVLEFADIEVVDLDETLGTKNADLLCSYGSHARLIEVKSAQGQAAERSYQDLIRHLREWPALTGARTIDGGVLVMNHEIRLPPAERHEQPYTRPEFLAAKDEPVVTALALFAAWRETDAGKIRELIFGSLADVEVGPPDGQSDRSTSHGPPAKRQSSSRRWFTRARRGGG
jgi:hypothetical protein